LIIDYLRAVLLGVKLLILLANKKNMDKSFVLDKERSLSEIVDDSYLFIKHNFIEMAGKIATTAGPFLFVSHAFSQKLQPEVVEGSSFIALLNLFALFASQALLNTIVYGYLIHKEQDTVFDRDAMWRYIAKHFFFVLSTFSSVFILLALGIVVFVIPGLYLFVPLSMIYIHRLQAYTSFTESLSFLIVLVKGNWWSTFGVLVIASLVLAVSALVFFIPLLWIDPTTGILPSAISATCYTAYYIVTSFVAVPIAMQYYNLKRKHF